MKSVLLALPVSLSLVACYGAAPPRPVHVPLPPMAEGAEIDVHSDTKTTYEPVSKQASTCPAGKAEGDPSCTVTRYTVTEPVTRTTTAASYGAEPITYAQFRVMTDPKWNEKLTALDDMAHACHRANIPRYAGMALFAVGLIGGPIIGAAGGGSVATAVTYGGMGLGGAAYALGYFAFGGRTCNEARALYNEMDMSAAMSWNTVEGAQYATEMKALAEQFNSMHVHRTEARVLPPIERKIEPKVEPKAEAKSATKLRMRKH